MSTLGDPLGDLALTLLYMTHVLPGESVDPQARRAVEVPGHPSVGQVIARYTSRSGVAVDDLRWYRAFAAFKLAAISQGVHHRYVHGGYGEHPNFADIGHLVAPLVAESLAVLDEETEGV
jgi:aminoglycoside phosphotransferase (APT) family kinase protein